MSFSARILLVFSFLLLLFVPPLIKPQQTHAALFGAFKTDAKTCDEEMANDKLQEGSDITGGTRLYKCKQAAYDFNANISAANFWILGPFDSRLIDKKDPSSKGAINAFASMSDSMIDTPPASGLAYTRYMLANVGLAPKAYAQGVGFVGLLPLFPLWAAFRNIAYSILIIVMFVIGFMVIFRMKIDPKTVISIQAAIPKIIVALLLITFSYAIAGFLIDLMYVFMALAINIIANALPKEEFEPYMTASTDLQTFFITGGWGALWASVFNWNLVGSFFKQTFGGSGANTGVGIIAEILGAVIGGGWAVGGAAAGTAVTAGALAWGIGLGVIAPIAIVLFIIALGLLFTVIRITFLLMNAYIQIIISVILSPLLLLQEAIPGRSALGPWLQNLIANLVVFPATVLVIYGSWIFTALAWKSYLWVPPLTPVGGGGDIGGSGNPLAILLGLGLIFMTPNLVAQIKKAFHPSSPLPLSTGTAFSPITGGVSTGMGAMSQFYYMQQLMGSHGQPGILRQMLGKLPGMGSFGGGDEHGKKV